MAQSKIIFNSSNGNLNFGQDGTSHISGLLFDVTTFPTSTTNVGADGDIYEIFSVSEAEALGITAFDKEDVGSAYEGGVPHFHISEFFRVNPNGQLYVGLKNIAAASVGDKWEFLGEIQSFAQGNIYQMGVHTEQNLFVVGVDEGVDPYTVSLLNDLQVVADSQSDANKPFVVLLSANCAGIESDGVTRLSGIPEIASGSHNRVSVLLGQGDSEYIQLMQGNNGASKSTIGCVGMALGALAKASVHESIAWVGKFDVSGGNIDKIAFGFGDVTDKVPGTDKSLADNTPLLSMTQAEIDYLEDKGYIFPLKYDRTGVFFSSDRTAASDDYRSISRNRAIDKSRRSVRNALLPTLNQPLYVDQATGGLSVSTIQRFKSLAGFPLQEMRKAGEISGFSVLIDPDQNVLSTDNLKIKYRLVPVGTAKNIIIETGFTAQTT